MCGVKSILYLEQNIMSRTSWRSCGPYRASA